MATSHLIRLSGLALMLGSVLFVFAGLIQMYLLFNPSNYLAIVGFVGPITLVAGPLVVLGLIGVCARQLEVAGILGLIAFFGSAFVIGVYWYNTFVVPSIAPVDFELLEFFEAERPLLYGGALILAYELLYLGWLLAGVTVLRRTRLFPRPAVMLLIALSLTAGILAVVGTLAGFPDVGSKLLYVDIAIGVLLNAILAWLGFALWLGGWTRETPRHTSRVSDSIVALWSRITCHGSVPRCLALLFSLAERILCVRASIAVARPHLLDAVSHGEHTFQGL